MHLTEETRDYRKRVRQLKARPAGADGQRMRTLRGAGLGLAVILAGAAPAAATPTISEVPGLSSPASAIVAGPDGALWVTQSADPGRIARVTADGVVTEYAAGVTPGFSANRQPASLAVGPDGALWFVERDGYVGRLTAGGIVSEFSGLKGTPTSIAAGPDGNMWVTEQGDDDDKAIARITPSGAVIEFRDGLSKDSEPDFITAGNDGTLRFTNAADKGSIGRITTGGVITESSDGIPSKREPAGITAGPDDAMWFTEAGSRGAIGRLSADGKVKEFTSGLTPKLAPTAITAGPDGALWFTAKDAIGRITTDGAISEYREGLTHGAAGRGITAGPDGAVWFTLTGAPRLGRITTPPGVAAAVATAETPTTAQITSAVRPNGFATTYHVVVRDAAGAVITGEDLGAGAGTGAVPVSFSVEGLKPSRAYTAAVVATSSVGTTSGRQASFVTQAGDGTSAPPASNPQPVLSKSVVLRATRGSVRVKVRGGSGFQALAGSSTVPVGALVDTRRGTVRLRSALRRGRTQAGRFKGGLFRVTQDGHGGRTDLLLRGRLDCNAATASASPTAQTARRKRKRRLWGSDNDGDFTTQGRDSVATVRGTKWLTQDTCRGTLVRVVEGAVAVRDRGTSKVTVVKAGDSHFTPHR